jgi:hypothetical protein
VDLIQNEETRAPVEAEPRYVPATATLPIEKTEHGQAWLRLVATVLGAIILIAIIVLLARWIYHASHHKAVGTTSTSQTPKASTNLKVSGQAAGSTDNNTASSSTNTNPATPNPQITNTGPGNVAAIFVGSSLAAAGLHYIISLRRFSRNRV